MEQRFVEIIQLIKESQSKAIKAAITELMNLYWDIENYISTRIETSEWGQSVVKELAFFIKQHEPELKGFSDKNLWLMKQFYETYRSSERLSALTRELSFQDADMGSNKIVIYNSLLEELGNEVVVCSCSEFPNNYSVRRNRR